MIELWERKRRDMSKIKLSNKIKKYGREYCDYTGIHGFKYIGEERSGFEKACWIIIFVLSLTVCLGVIYKSYIKWQRTPVIVNFASEEKRIYEIPFPAVTICQEVKISKSYFNYSGTLLRLAKGKGISADETKKLQYMSLICDPGKIYHEKIPRTNVTDEGIFSFLEKGRYEFFSKCTWMGQCFECSEIFQPTMTDEGLCMSFNMLSDSDLFREKVMVQTLKTASYVENKADNWSVEYGYSKGAGIDTYPRRALLSGSSNALIVNMNVSLDDLDYACTKFQGFQVVLHLVIRFPIVQPHYFRVPLGKSVIVAISPTQVITSDDVKEYHYKKRNCLTQDEAKLKFFKHYTQYNCNLECLTKQTLTVCGCVAYYMPRVNKSTPICGNGKRGCMRRVQDSLEMADLQHSINRDAGTFVKKMKCNCIPMCTVFEYNTEITEIDYDWYKELESVGVNENRDEKYSSSQLVLYMKSEHFIPYERNELYGNISFLANVGGLLGLFVGFSLLSFFEIIYFLTIRIVCNMKLYKKWYGKEES